MTACPSLSPGPLSGSRGQALDCERPRSAHFPHIKPWGAQRTNFNCSVPVRIVRADPIKLVLRRFRTYCLFHDYGISSVYFRYRLPRRQGVERLPSPEGFDQSLSFTS